MDDLKLQSSQKTQLGIPNKWEEKFLLKRIGDGDIELSLSERNGILQSLNKGDRFVQIRKYTFMLNAIKSIEPMWGEKNTPPRPNEITKTEYVGNRAVVTILNQDEIDEWNKLFEHE